MYSYHLFLISSASVRSIPFLSFIEPIFVRSMNQGKFKAVKQEMASVVINVFRISKLKRTGMGEFNSMTIISTTAGKNALEEKEKTS